MECAEEKKKGKRKNKKKKNKRRASVGAGCHSESGVLIKSQKLGTLNIDIFLLRQVLF